MVLVKKTKVTVLAPAAAAAQKRNDSRHKAPFVLTL